MHLIISILYVYLQFETGFAEGETVGLGSGFAVGFTVGIILDDIEVRSEVGLHVGTFAVGARAPIHKLIEQQINVY